MRPRPFNFARGATPAAPPTFQLFASRTPSPAICKALSRQRPAPLSIGAGLCALWATSSPSCDVIRGRLRSAECDSEHLALSWSTWPFPERIRPFSRIRPVLPEGTTAFPATHPHLPEGVPGPSLGAPGPFLGGAIDADTSFCTRLTKCYEGMVKLADMKP